MIKKTRLIKDFSYPSTNDPELISKIYKKREFYYNRVPKRNKLSNYEDIETLSFDTITPLAIEHYPFRTIET